MLQLILANMGMAAGSPLLSIIPATFGISGYLVPIAVIPGVYGLFQTANNTAVMSDLPPDQRGAISGMLNLSRNLGRITGASVMGAYRQFGAPRQNDFRYLARQRVRWQA